MSPQPSSAKPLSDRTEKYDYFDFYYDSQGSIPGTLTIEADAHPTHIVLIDYSAEKAVRERILDPMDCLNYKDEESVSWVDVQGLGSEDVWMRLGEVFHLHPLVLEDVVNVPQRPKVEDYNDQLLIVAHMVMPLPIGKGFMSEQVSFVLGKHYLLTVQEEPAHDCFQAVRDRIRTSKGRIRQMGADYLAYALLDAVIDGFFPILESYGEHIENLENEVVSNPSHKTLQKIYQVRRELLALRRTIWPQRTAIGNLIQEGSDLITPEVQVYLRDCYDHTIQVLDLVETYRELASGLMDVYISSVSNKMNEVMKLLTVISTIFIPLSFVAGVYGMNFNTEVSSWNMPELNGRFGYPLCLLGMLMVALSMLGFFWKRGWFQDFSKIPKE